MKTKWKTNLSTFLKHILSTFNNPKLARIILALCADTHWEFGKMNIKDPPKLSEGPRRLTSNNYLKFIKTSLRKIEKETLKNKYPLSRNKPIFSILVKLCMAVSCADIASSYNNELLEGEHKPLFTNLGIKVSSMVYKSSGGAWVKYKMRENHPKYIKQVLVELRTSHPKTIMSRKRSKRASKYAKKYVGPLGGVYILNKGVKRYI